LKVDRFRRRDNRAKKSLSIRFKRGAINIGGTFKPFVSPLKYSLRTQSATYLGALIELTEAPPFQP
jgi:hypothetical protein